MVLVSPTRGDYMEEIFEKEVLQVEAETPQGPVSDEPVQEHAQEVSQENSQEKNWREIRAALKELKRENQLLREQALSPKKETAPVEDEDDDEPYVTPKRLNKKLQELERQLKQKDAEGVEDRLRAKFPDYDEVLTVENVEYMQQHDPELVLSIQRMSDDPYKQALAAYKLLKKTDYHMNKGTMQEKQKAEDNSKRPVSVQAVRKQGALAEANRFSNGLTSELKKALYREMQDCRKRT